MGARSTWTQVLENYKQGRGRPGRKPVEIRIGGKSRITLVKHGESMMKRE